MAMSSKFMSSINRWRDKTKLNKFIRGIEVLNEQEYQVDRVKAGTVFVEDTGKRLIYMGRCLSHMNHCGIYQEVDQFDMPTSASIHAIGGKKTAMKEVKYYSPREWLEHIYKTTDPSEIMKKVKEKDKMIFRA